MDVGGGIDPQFREGQILNDLAVVTEIMRLPQQLRPRNTNSGSAGDAGRQP